MLGPNAQLVKGPAPSTSKQISHLQYLRPSPLKLCGMEFGLLKIEILIISKSKSGHTSNFSATLNEICLQSTTSIAPVSFPEKERQRSALHVSTRQVFLSSLTCPAIFAQPSSVTPGRCCCQHSHRDFQKQMSVNCSFLTSMLVFSRVSLSEKQPDFIPLGERVLENSRCTQPYKASGRQRNTIPPWNHTEIETTKYRMKGQYCHSSHSKERHKKTVHRK